MRACIKSIVITLIAGSVLGCSGSEPSGLGAPLSSPQNASANGGSSAPGEPGPVPSSPPHDEPVPPEEGTIFQGTPEVGKYVYQFMDDAKSFGVDVRPMMQNPTLEIRIGWIVGYPTATIGLCETGYGRRRLSVSPAFWNSASETGREQILYHELGHCVLGRRHLDDLLSTGNFASIMHSKIMPSREYLENRAYYLEELFLGRGL